MKQGIAGEPGMGDKAVFPKLIRFIVTDHGFFPLVGCSSKRTPLSS